MEKPKIPANLLEALRKIESSGTIPLLIPMQLENFLTEQGVYRSSMTPDVAWRALQALSEGRPVVPPVEAVEIVPPVVEAKPVEEPLTTQQKEPPSNLRGNALLRELRRRKK